MPQLVVNMNDITSSNICYKIKVNIIKMRQAPYSNRTQLKDQLKEEIVLKKRIIGNFNKINIDG